MAWNFHSVNDSQANQALNDLLNWVNSQVTAYCCKYAASDMSNGDATAIVFYSNVEVAIPSNQPTGNTKWQMQTFTTGTDYPTMFNSAKDAYNKLTPYQQFYASVALTNANNHDAWIAIYYPIN